VNQKVTKKQKQNGYGDVKQYGKSVGNVRSAIGIENVKGRGIGEDVIGDGNVKAEGFAENRTKDANFINVLLDGIHRKKIFGR